MKTCFTVISLVLIASDPAAAKWGGGDVTIIRSDERSIVFEYRPRYLAGRVVRDGNIEMKVINFAGSIPTYTRELIGAPDIRYAAIPLGFPSEEGNGVQVVASDYEDLAGVMLAPVPAMRERDGLIEIQDYKTNPEKYSSSSFIPPQPVDLPQPGRTRSMVVGSVRIFPVQFNPATHTVRKYTRLVVEVVFGRSNRPRVQNDDDRMFGGALLNYSVSRNWKFSGEPTLTRTNAVSSVLANGDWYRLAVIDEGVYVLTAPYLRGIGVNTATLDPRSIRIYGNGGTEVPENIAAQRANDLVENAIYVEGEGDGRFDESDYVIFFARSVRNWRFNTSTHQLEHYIHRYAPLIAPMPAGAGTEQNYYWLTIGGSNGKRMQVQTSSTDNPVMTPTKFLHGIQIEEELVNVHSSGKDWFGKSYAPNMSFTYANLLTGLVPNDVITYRFGLLAARSNGFASFVVTDGGSPLGEHFINTFGEDPSEIAVQVNGTSNLTGSTSRLNFSFRGSLTATGWNDWIEIQYPRKFEASGGYLRFRSPDTVSGVVQYTLEQFASLPFILNVTRPDSVCRIVGAVGTYTFRAPETAGRVSEYCAANSGAFKLPVAFTRVANQDLHGDVTGADFIIVTSSEFRSAANRLKDFREQPAHGNLRTVVVDLNQIYNEFGGGIPDITAIRDYLKYAYSNWTRRPQFVLFLGQGSYDYKGLLGGRSSYVPTWQTDESLNDIGTYSTDDFFVKFNTGPSPFLVTGRVNPRSPAEAEAFVTKLIGYETASAQDSWKMRMLYVGDDGWTSDCGECEGTLHSGQVEDLATNYTPNQFEKKKIYIAEYPTVQSAQGRRKPGAYQDIIDRINEGALVVNFTGHGNPTVWTHESVFSVPTSIPQLVNGNRLAVFFLATCNFSQFDDPVRYTGSELLINKPDGGAIGAVSATRKVFSHDNAFFHQEVFARMLDTLAGRLIVERPATAIYLFKTTVRNSDNDQKFFYMGDPTMRLQYPAGYASIDSINHQSLTGSPIPLKALAKISVQGTVRDVSNQPDSTFTGRILLAVNDASRAITIVNFAPGVNWTYLGAGGTIYRGQNSVTRGKFNATFVVPKDILYADSTSKGRLVTYFIDSVRAYEGAGFTENIRVGGTENAPPDTTGPVMSLYLGNRGFRSGDMVGEEPTLLVDLADSNGINTSVSGIGHRIEAWLNGSAQSKDITDFYSSQLDDYQKGTVQYSLKALPQGRNTIRVRAWDTHNNASAKETFFEVTSTDQLRISDVFNYPNPFSRGTSFTFRQNLLASLNVTVKIYTVAGRLIQSLYAISSNESFVRIPWDGRDRDGDILANGVYLYKVIVRTTDGRFGSEVLGKLSVLK